MNVSDPFHTHFHSLCPEFWETRPLPARVPSHFPTQNSSSSNDGRRLAVGAARPDSTTNNTYLNESATQGEEEHWHTGRHTWTTSSRALVENNLKEGSGGGERVPGERVREREGGRTFAAFPALPIASAW